MKMIAHRGASLERTENTLDSLLLGAELGAYAVESDLRLTGDGHYVMFHDDNLLRLTGDPRRICEVTEAEMRTVLAEKNIPLLTFDDILSRYDGKSHVLLDMSVFPKEICADLYKRISEACVSFLFGVHCVWEAEIARNYVSPERILAFMPGENDYEAFYRAGAGNIRLWEQWLDRVTPETVKKACPGAEVWIMSNRPETGMNGTRESLVHLDALGADGVLLNDIRLGVEYEKEKINRSK